MFGKIFSLLLKPFLGSGITEKFPFLRKVYEVFYNMMNKGYKTSRIPLGLDLKYNASDSGLGVYLSLKGEYEPFTTKLFIENIGKHDVFFDVGANVGYFSIIGKKAGAEVYSFEPDKRNLDLLKENFEINKLSPNIQPVALGNQEGEISFVENDLQQGNSQVSQAETANKVKITTLDNFVKNHVKPTFFKVDIEGYECEFLKGGKSFFESSRNLKMVMECNQKSLKEFGFSTEILIEQLEDYGFKVKVIDENHQEVFDASNKSRLKGILDKYNYTNLWCEK
jgi:FkbM family methyltransferase